MLKIIIVFLLFFSVGFCNAQNLVPNNSFEIYDTCPNSAGKICNAVPWFQPRIALGNVCNSSSSEAFNQCSSSFQNDVPDNGVGYQYAKTGNGYAGAVFYYGSTNNGREYIEVGLVDSFTQGKKYYVEFYVSLADQCNYAIDGLGAYFSKDSVLDSTTSGTNQLLPYVPQVQNPANNFISDTMNWAKVSGSFIAAGGEKFMTIGNFLDSVNTNVNIINGTWNAAYYYIDDVLVIDSGWVGINEPQENNSIKIFPNPTNGIFTIKNDKIKSVEVINALGEKIYSTQITNNQIAIDISDKPKGIYFVRIKTEEGTVVKKIAVQ